MRGDIGHSLLRLDHMRKGWATLSIDWSIVSNQEGQGGGPFQEPFSKSN